MEATSSFGGMADRVKLSLRSGCDMILVCNNRDAALKAVAALNDYSNPLSLVRLARLHGTGHTIAESLHLSEEWQEANALFTNWSARPRLQLKS
jgi:beta-N-acetylhexosaminidase